MKNVYIKNTDQKTWAKIILWAEDIKEGCTKGCDGSGKFYGFTSTGKFHVWHSAPMFSYEQLTFPEYEYYPMGKEMLIWDDEDFKRDRCKKVFLTANKAVDEDFDCWDRWEEIKDKKQSKIKDLESKANELKQGLEEILLEIEDLKK